MSGIEWTKEDFYVIYRLQMDALLAEYPDLERDAHFWAEPWTMAVLFHEGWRWPGDRE